MNHKFNAGDKVKCVDSGHTSLKVGEVYTVSGYNYLNNVTLQGRNGGYFPSRFKLVEPAAIAETLHIGDLVKCVDATDTGAGELLEGFVYAVADFKFDGAMVRLTSRDTYWDRKRFVKVKNEITALKNLGEENTKLKAEIEELKSQLNQREAEVRSLNKGTESADRAAKNFERALEKALAERDMFEDLANRQFQAVLAAVGSQDTVNIMPALTPEQPATRPWGG